MNQTLSVRERERDYVSHYHKRQLAASHSLEHPQHFHLQLQEISLQTQRSSQQLSQRIKPCSFQSMCVNRHWGCLRETTFVNFDLLLM